MNSFEFNSQPPARVCLDSWLAMTGSFTEVEMATVITLKFENGTLEWESAAGWKSVETEIRPYGTMGYWTWDGETLTRKTSSGRPAYRYTLRNEGQYKAGPEYTHRVKSVGEEKDPIKRVLLEFDIPMSKLEIAEGEADLFPGFIMDGGQNRSLRDMIVTDANLINIRFKSYTGPATFVVHMRACDSGCNLYRKVEKVSVWEGCKPDQLREALRVALDGGEGGFVYLFGGKEKLDMQWRY